MDPTTLYYALSTIAQCAAELAALTGFLGLWRLDWSREQRDQVIQMIHRQLNVSQRITGLGIRKEIALLGDEYFVQKAEAYVEELARERDEDSLAELKLKHAAARWKDIPGDQQQLLWALRVFLVITLCILDVAVVSFRYVDQATTWPWTPRLLWVVGMMLAGGPIVVLWIAARLPRVLIALTLLLILASPAPNLLLAAEPLKRTLIRSVPAGNVYEYESALGETVEEMENRQGELLYRRFYRPAPPACAYLHSVGLGTGRYWSDDDERVFH